MSPSKPSTTGCCIGCGGACGGACGGCGGGALLGSCLNDSVVGILVSIPGAGMLLSIAGGGIEVSIGGVGATSLVLSSSKKASRIFVSSNISLRVMDPPSALTMIKSTSKTANTIKRLFILFLYDYVEIFFSPNSIFLFV